MQRDLFEADHELFRSSVRDFVERSMRHGCRICSSTALIRRSAVPPGGFRVEDAPPVGVSRVIASGRRGLA